MGATSVPLRGLRVALVVAVLWFAAAAGGVAAASPPAGNDCDRCHRCPTPTRAEPCLRACPRDSAVATTPAGGPDVCVLDDLSDLYVPVHFNHREHARMSGLSDGCAACHHFTEAAARHPACRSCHPPSIAREDLAQPGLKGAYHRLCFQCHVEWNADTACEVCHEKRAGGKLAGASVAAPGSGASPAGVHHAMRPAPLEIKDLIIFSTGNNGGDRVPFHHRNHATLYETDCAACHRNESCAQCHRHGSASHPLGDPLEADLHEVCNRCHREGEGSLPDNRCEHCHGRKPDDLFDHASTGWPLASYHRSIGCRDCHGSWTSRARLDGQCERCHKGGWDPATFDHRVTGVTLNTAHREAACTDCHAEGIGRRASCAACHDDGRVYSRASGFGG